MPEFRKDPVVGRWVIVAEKEEPSLISLVKVGKGKFFSLCVLPGRESCTPPEVFSIRKKILSPMRGLEGEGGA